MNIVCERSDYSTSSNQPSLQQVIDNLNYVFLLLTTLARLLVERER
jgi:hypothetical protein